MGAPVNIRNRKKCILVSKKCILLKICLFLRCKNIINVKSKKIEQSLGEIRNMKITLQQIAGGKEEVIIKYRQMTEQIEDIVCYIEGAGGKLIGIKDGQQVVVRPQSVIYLESVDGSTYLYTEEEVYKSGLTLVAAETAYAEKGYFRCSKSMVVNIYRIARLKSMPGNRIDATMDNGEHIVISRRYAKELRSILRGEER